MKHVQKLAIIMLAVLALTGVRQPVLAGQETHTRTAAAYTQPSGWAQNTDGSWVFLNKDGSLTRKTWLYESGRRYYFNALGEMVTGVVSINGAYERFSDTGIYKGKASGWCTDLDDGLIYYLDGRGMKTTGKITLNKKDYYLDPRNGMLYTKGWWLAPDANGLLYADDNGVLSPKAQADKWVHVQVLNEKTWQVEKHWAYFLQGSPLKKQWAEIDNAWYRFDENGLAYDSGTYALDGSFYTFTKDGNWITKPNTWLSFTDGYGQTQWSYINGDAKSATGWQTIGGHIYYFDAEGVMAYGAKSIGGTVYYFSADGSYYAPSQCRGWMHICDSKLKKYNHWYYFGQNGRPVNGWLKVDGFWYYFDSTGKAADKQVVIDGKQYYFYTSKTGAAPACSMAVGWVQDEFGHWLYAKENGSLVTGWIQLGGTWYYMDDNGIMTVGWERIDGKWYYFDMNGAMAANTVVQDIYTVDKDGCWIE